MSGSKTLEKISLLSGNYYLVERNSIDQLYQDAGYKDDIEVVPSFIKVDGKECLFTEQFLEKDGKEYEIVIVADGFSWADVMIHDDGEEE